jgi:hypothetical protein
MNHLIPSLVFTVLFTLIARDGVYQKNPIPMNDRISFTDLHGNTLMQNQSDDTEPIEPFEPIEFDPMELQKLAYDEWLKKRERGKSSKYRAPSNLTPKKKKRKK